MTEEQHLARERVIHAAAIRAALCAARGLPPSSGCHVCGATEAVNCEQCVPGIAPPVECDSEGGTAD